MVTKVKIKELIKALLQIQSQGFVLINVEEKEYNTIKIIPVKQEVLTETKIKIESA